MHIAHYRTITTAESGGKVEEETQGATSGRSRRLSRLNRPRPTGNKLNTGNLASGCCTMLLYSTLIESHHL